MENYLLHTKFNNLYTTHSKFNLDASKSTKKLKQLKNIVLSIGN